MALADFDPLIITWCAFALFCGGLIKGTLGVGTPLLTVPLMALVVPAQTAVVLMAIPVVVANVWQAARARVVRSVVSRFWPMFLAIVGGTLAGVFILANIDDRTLLLVVGIVVIAFTILQASSYKLRIPSCVEKPVGMVFGCASGLVGGLSSMFGPMLIIYLVSLPGLDKERFVASISFLYIACVVPWALLLMWFGVLTWHLTLLSTLATIPVVVGLLLGERLRGRVSDDRFSRLVLGVLLVSGGTMLVRAFN